MGSKLLSANLIRLSGDECAVLCDGLPATQLRSSSHLMAASTCDNKEVYKILYSTEEAVSSYRVMGALKRRASIGGKHQLQVLTSIPLRTYGDPWSTTYGPLSNRRIFRSWKVGSRNSGEHWYLLSAPSTLDTWRRWYPKSFKKMVAPLDISTYSITMHSIFYMCVTL